LQPSAACSFSPYGLQNCGFQAAIFKQPAYYVTPDNALLSSALTGKSGILILRREPPRTQSAQRFKGACSVFSNFTFKGTAFQPSKTNKQALAVCSFFSNFTYQ
jgi:hypothetical protein